MKQKFVENGFQHPYCSRTCARGGPNIKNPSSPPCGIPRCRAPASNAGFCSDVHARYAWFEMNFPCSSQCRIVGRRCGLVLRSLVLNAACNLRPMVLYVRLVTDVIELDLDCERSTLKESLSIAVSSVTYLNGTCLTDKTQL